MIKTNLLSGFIYTVGICLTSVVYAEEYCTGDTFSPVCERNEVVVIERAEYGRMRMGRCVTTDQELGCSADVISYVSRACSGRQTCKFFAISQNVGSKEPCGELRSYLDVTYSCLPVVTVGSSLCTTSTTLLLSEREGYISSAVATNRGCGTIKAPWKIEAEPGQSINVSLINYTPAVAEQSAGASNTRCRPLGYIYDVAQNNNVSICDTAAARAHVYVSISHILQIQLITDHHIIDDQPSFLLHYSVVGCKDLHVASSMWYKRDGSTVTLGCKNTKMSWNLNCEANQWVGVIGNCTEADQGVDDGSSWNLFSDSYAVALIVVISLGVLLFIVTVLCVYCVGSSIMDKRSRRQQQQQQQEEQMSGNMYSTDSIIRPHPLHLRHLQQHHQHLQSVPAMHHGYMLQQPAAAPSMTSSVDDTERSCDQLLPEHEQLQQLHDPTYFILDKDYMDQATLQIR